MAKHTASRKDFSSPKAARPPTYKLLTNDWVTTRRPADTFMVFTHSKKETQRRISVWYNKHIVESRPPHKRAHRVFFSCTRRQHIKLPYKNKPFSLDMFWPSLNTEEIQGRDDKSLTDEKGISNISRHLRIANKRTRVGRTMRRSEASWSCARISLSLQYHTWQEKWDASSGVAIHVGTGGCANEFDNEFHWFLKISN